jgi:hypothetical protein
VDKYVNNGYKNDCNIKGGLLFYLDRHREKINYATKTILWALRTKELYREIFAPIELEIVEHLKTLLPANFAKRQIVIPMSQGKGETFIWNLKWIGGILKTYETQFNYQILSYYSLSYYSDSSELKNIFIEYNWRYLYNGLCAKMMQKIQFLDSIAPPHILSSSRMNNDRLKRNVVDNNLLLSSAHSLEVQHPLIIVCIGRTYIFVHIFEKLKMLCMNILDISLKSTTVSCSILGNNGKVKEIIARNQDSNK